MKKLVALLLSVVLFTIPATTIFAQDAYEDNDFWYYARPMVNPGIGQTGQAYFGNFHDNPDPDYFYFVSSPNYNQQFVLFMPPDDQDYIFAVYKQSDFAAGLPVISPVAYKFVTDGQLAVLSFKPQPGTVYLVLVQGTNYNTYPTGNYMLLAYQDY